MAEGAGSSDQLISAEEACALLEVAAEQLSAMVEEGLLTPASGGEAPRFRRSEVLAARELGG